MIGGGWGSPVGTQGIEVAQFELQPIESPVPKDRSQESVETAQELPDADSGGNGWMLPLARGTDLLQLASEGEQAPPPALPAVPTYELFPPDRRGSAGFLFGEPQSYLTPAGDPESMMRILPAGSLAVAPHVVSSLESMKKIFCMPATSESVALKIHRIGNTLVFEDAQAGVTAAAGGEAGRTGRQEGPAQGGGGGGQQRTTTSGGEAGEWVGGRARGRGKPNLRLPSGLREGPCEGRGESPGSPSSSASPPSTVRGSMRDAQELERRFVYHAVQAQKFQQQRQEGEGERDRGESDGRGRQMGVPASSSPCPSSEPSPIPLPVSPGGSPLTPSVPVCDEQEGGGQNDTLCPVTDERTESDCLSLSLPFPQILAVPDPKTKFETAGEGAEKQGERGEEASLAKAASSGSREAAASSQQRFFGIPLGLRRMGRAIDWSFHPFRVLLGSDVVIFRNSALPSVSLKLLESGEQLTMERRLDLWVESLICSVEKVALCFHRGGVLDHFRLEDASELPRWNSRRRRQQQEQRARIAGGSNEDLGTGRGELKGKGGRKRKSRARRGSADSIEVREVGVSAPRRSWSDDEDMDDVEDVEGGGSGGEEEEEWSSEAVLDQGRRLLHFLHRECSVQGGTYLLFRDAGVQNASLFDLTEPSDILTLQDKGRRPAGGLPINPEGPSPPDPAEGGEGQGETVGGDQTAKRETEGDETNTAVPPYTTDLSPKYSSRPAAPSSSSFAPFGRSSSSDDRQRLPSHEEETDGSANPFDTSAFRLTLASLCFHVSTQIRTRVDIMRTAAHKAAARTATAAAGKGPGDGNQIYGGSGERRGSGSAAAASGERHKVDRHTHRVPASGGISASLPHLRTWMVDSFADLRDICQLPPLDPPTVSFPSSSADTADSPSLESATRQERERRELEEAERRLLMRALAFLPPPFSSSEKEQHKETSHTPHSSSEDANSSADAGEEDDMKENASAPTAHIRLAVASHAQLAQSLLQIGDFSFPPSPLLKKARLPSSSDADTGPKSQEETESRRTMQLVAAVFHAAAAFSLLRNGREGAETGTEKRPLTQQESRLCVLFAESCLQLACASSLCFINFITKNTLLRRDTGQKGEEESEREKGRDEAWHILNEERSLKQALLAWTLRRQVELLGRASSVLDLLPPSQRSVECPNLDSSLEAVKGSAMVAIGNCARSTQWPVCEGMVSMESPEFESLCTGRLRRICGEFDRRGGRDVGTVLGYSAVLEDLLWVESRMDFAFSGLTGKGGRSGEKAAGGWVRRRCAHSVENPQLPRLQMAFSQSFHPHLACHGKALLGRNLGRAMKMLRERDGARRGEGGFCNSTFSFPDLVSALPRVLPMCRRLCSSIFSDMKELMGDWESETQQYLYRRREAGKDRSRKFLTYLGRLVMLWGSRGVALCALVEDLASLHEFLVQLGRWLRHAVKPVKLLSLKPGSEEVGLCSLPLTVEQYALLRFSLRLSEAAVWVQEKLQRERTHTGGASVKPRAAATEIEGSGGGEAADGEGRGEKRESEIFESEVKAGKVSEERKEKEEDNTLREECQKSPSATAKTIVPPFPQPQSGRQKLLRELEEIAAEEARTRQELLLVELQEIQRSLNEGPGGAGGGILSSSVSVLGQQTGGREEAQSLLEVASGELILGVLLMELSISGQQYLWPGRTMWKQHKDLLPSRGCDLPPAEEKEAKGKRDDPGGKSTRRGMGTEAVDEEEKSISETAFCFGASLPSRNANAPSIEGIQQLPCGDSEGKEEEEEEEVDASWGWMESARGPLLDHLRVSFHFKFPFSSPLNPFFSPEDPRKPFGICFQEDIPDCWDARGDSPSLSTLADAVGGAVKETGGAGGNVRGDGMLQLALSHFLKARSAAVLGHSRLVQLHGGTRGGRAAAWALEVGTVFFHTGACYELLTAEALTGGQRADNLCKMASRHLWKAVSFFSPVLVPKDFVRVCCRLAVVNQKAAEASGDTAKNSRAGHSVKIQAIALLLAAESIALRSYAKACQMQQQREGLERKEKEKEASREGGGTGTPSTSVLDALFVFPRVPSVASEEVSAPAAADGGSPSQSVPVGAVGIRELLKSCLKDLLKVYTGTQANTGSRKDATGAQSSRAPHPISAESETSSETVTERGREKGIVEELQALTKRWDRAIGRPPGNLPVVKDLFRRVLQDEDISLLLDSLEASSKPVA